MLCSMLLLLLAVRLNIWGGCLLLLTEIYLCLSVGGLPILYRYPPGQSKTSSSNQSPFVSIEGPPADIGRIHPIFLVVINTDDGGGRPYSANVCEYTVAQISIFY